jgi:site-specific recombinase XerD
MTDSSIAAKQGPPAPTFDSELRVFLKTAGGGQSRHTALTYQNGLTYFSNYLTETYDWSDEQPIAELTPEMLSEFPSWLLTQSYRRSPRTAAVPLAESTRSLYLLAVSRFLRFLVLRKHLPHFDYAEYERVKEELSQATNVKTQPLAKKIPATEIVIALVTAAEQPPVIKEDAKPTHRRRLYLVWLRNRAMIHALRSSGMRVGELTSLKRADLDPHRQGAWVTGKGRKTRFVAFDDQAWETIQRYLTERHDEMLLVKTGQHPLFCRHDRSAGTDRRLPVSARTVQQVFKELSEAANISQRFNMSPHSLRHYFANGLLEFSGNLALVQEALGHNDPKTTRGYTKIRVDEIAANVQAMSSGQVEDEAEDDEEQET